MFHKDPKFSYQDEEVGTVQTFPNNEVSRLDGTSYQA